MKPDSPFDDDDALKPPSDQPLPNQLGLPPASSASSDSAVPLNPLELSPLEGLQRRYSDQLSHDIEQLETNKAQLQAEITALKADYARLRQTASAATDEASDPAAANFSGTSGPRLPGEPAAKRPSEPKLAEPLADGTDNEPSEAAQAQVAQPQASLFGLAATRGSVELPIPSTSERQRRARSDYQQAVADGDQRTLRRGLVLSAIATLIMAWHFCVVGALGQGGTWLGIPIGQLGAGFVPAVALLWLRMLVMMPALGILAPQLHRRTWEELQDWIYNRDRLLLLLIGSGTALFFSQVLIYQCISIVGPAIGVMLLFLYPLTAVPLGSAVGLDRKMSALGLLAVVAIAMGGILTIRPVLSLSLASSSLESTASVATPLTILLGFLASAAFSLYVVLTNLSYQQQCHPIPVSIVQFSTVAVLSSIVLLVKPLKPVAIDWLSFALWGILLGLLMLLVYLFSYGSLRLMGARTAVVAAFTPLATLLLAWSFAPKPALTLIQWTGILLVTMGGIALGQEKLTSAKETLKETSRETQS